MWELWVNWQHRVKHKHTLWLITISDVKSALLSHDLWHMQACQIILQKAFQIEGYSWRVAWKKPFLDERKRELHLSLAMAHQRWTKEDWCQVIWTDECYVWLSGQTSWVWVTRCPGEEFQDDSLISKFPKKNSIILWGGLLEGSRASCSSQIRTIGEQ